MDYMSQWRARKAKIMAQSCAATVISVKTEADSSDVEWSNELDHLPLLQRRKLLVSPNQSKTLPQPRIAVKREDEQCESQQFVCVPSASPVNKGTGDKFELGSGVVDHTDYPESYTPLNCGNLGTKVNTNSCSDKVTCSGANCNTHKLEKGNASLCNSHENQMVLKGPTEIKVECSSNLQSSLGSGLCALAGAGVHELKPNGDVSNDFADDLDHIVLKERLGMLLSGKMLKLKKTSSEGIPLESNSSDSPNCPPTSTHNMPSSILNSVKVKDEPVECNELYGLGRNASADYPSNFPPVKNELEIPSESDRDNVDHMNLQDRMNLQMREQFEVNISGTSESSRKIDSSVFEHGPDVFEAPDPVRIIRPRKRKKTATDSIETALAEDAPGLLEVLIEQGVSVYEIKLYGEAESDELIDESFIEDGFTDLEAVMSKLFFNRSSLLKYTPIRCSKASKPSYCLACLFSLVEQTRYLRFRNWPAEWGWCRDLQSFIFVFEKHNRIVLERPEYGYATYFFQLVGSFPIVWQIKRLVTAMKLTNCGRITLLENKALMVGEDITEGEAQVLMQFGWTPNSGLGTMLNYCDRVVHDRKQERDTSEWRSKIGKLLMDGYQGGSIVSTNIHNKVVDFSSGENPQIKVEL